MDTRIGWGLIGASNIARQRVAGAIQRSRRGALVGIMSHQSTLAQAFAAEFAIPHHCSSVPDLLGLGGVDAVYLSSTNQYHREQVLAAAAAGKHVLCEKPLATSLDDAVEMVRACRKAGVIMGTNHQLRASVAVNALREAIANGDIGTPVSATLSQPVHVDEADWRRTHPAAGSGVAFDVLVHGADAIRYILGQEPVAVSAMGRAGPSMADRVHDALMATYRFDGGALAVLYADFNCPDGRTRLEIHGPRGSLYGWDVLGKAAAFRGRVTLRTAGRDHELAVESDDSRYLAGIDRFNGAVLGDGQPLCSGIDGIRSLAMILGAEASAQSGSTLRVSEAGLDLL